MFIGIHVRPSDELLSLLTFLKKELSNSDIQWVEPDNMHFTLKFLGNVHPDLIQNIKEKLNIVSGQSFPFESKITGLNRFDRNKHTAVIWSSLSGENQISLLAQKVILSMSEIGFAPETRPFKAHLTLGRVGKICDEEKLISCIILYQNKFLQVLKINELILFESLLFPSGPIYKVIERFNFNPIN